MTKIKMFPLRIPEEWHVSHNWFYDTVPNPNRLDNWETHHQLYFHGTLFYATHPSGRIVDLDWDNFSDDREQYLLQVYEEDDVLNPSLNIRSKNGYFIAEEIERQFALLNFKNTTPLLLRIPQLWTILVSEMNATKQNQVIFSATNRKDAKIKVEVHGNHSEDRSYIITFSKDEGPQIRCVRKSFEAMLEVAEAFLDFQALECSNLPLPAH